MPAGKTVALTSKTVKKRLPAHSTDKNHPAGTIGVSKRDTAYGTLKNSVRIHGDIIGRTGARWSADAA
jgi:hypothetical protein